MSLGRQYFQPSIRQLLAAEALSEAQVVTGEERLDEQVTGVVFGLASSRAGNLVVERVENLASQDAASFKELAAVIAVKPVTQPKKALAGIGGSAVSGMRALHVEIDIEKLAQAFNEVNVPLIVLPGLNEPAQVAEEVRLALLTEIKRGAARLHTHFVSLVLENGLQALVDDFAELIKRPVAVETADFKLLAGQNMGPTPASQQKTLNEQANEELRRDMKAKSQDVLTGLPEKPLRLGRRLVMPIVLEGVVVGYLSVMVRVNDDQAMFSEYLMPASLAALVDFSHRRKEVSTFTVTQRTILKDLLSGVSLSAGDMERLEQHFGFDLCDGFKVIIFKVLPQSLAKEVPWAQSYEGLAMVDMEATKVFVFPHDGKTNITWQQNAEEILKTIKGANAQLKVQVGASRIAVNLLDLPDAYTEARQALIIGSMMHGESEFSVGYGELGIKRLLYLLIDHPELEVFYEEKLGKLEAYDAEWEAELVPTLKVYLEQGANLNSAAKALFVHRHTMRYRLEQIAEILDVDIDAQPILLDLQIAFLIREMKGKANP